MEELNDGFLVVIFQTAVALEFRELGIVVNYQFEVSVLFHTAGNQIGVDRAACIILRTEKALVKSLPKSSPEMASSGVAPATPVPASFTFSAMASVLPFPYSY